MEIKQKTKKEISEGIESKLREARHASIACGVAGISFAVSASIVHRKFSPIYLIPPALGFLGPFVVYGISRGYEKLEGLYERYKKHEIH